MAEQLLVAAVVRFAEDDMVEMAADGVVQLAVPPDGLRLSWWLEIHLEDVDHELLYQAALDGIEDASTGYQYGFGRMDYEGMFSLFNELNSRYHGAPHPTAPLEMTPPEAATERHVHEAVEHVAALLAQAALAGEPRCASHRSPDRTVRVALLLKIAARLDEELGAVRLPESLDSYAESASPCGCGSQSGSSSSARMGGRSAGGQAHDPVTTGVGSPTSTRLVHQPAVASQNCTGSSSALVTDRKDDPPLRGGCVRRAGPQRQRREVVLRVCLPQPSRQCARACAAGYHLVKTSHPPLPLLP